MTAQQNGKIKRLKIAGNFTLKLLFVYSVSLHGDDMCWGFGFYLINLSA
ncbi:hypothetical protein [Acinetobacter sp. YH12090]|nr:hypothetical protein [Acinetobacter sp. YH12090]